MLINRSTVSPVGDGNNPLNTAELFFGDALDCAGVFADVDNSPDRFPTAIGSWYLSNAGGATAGGAMYFKATNIGNPGDWLKIVLIPCQGRD